MLSPELEQHVAADGDSNERSAAYVDIVHDGRDVGGVFLHGGWAFADAGLSVSAQVGQDHAIARGQSLGYGQPEFMVGGKRMQQDYGRSGAERPVDNFGVAAFDALGGNELHAGIR